MIEIQDVTKDFGSTRALRGVRCQIAAGRIVGLLGPNGAGKSTLMRIITTYLAATSGRVRVAGFDVGENPLEVRRRIGYLPEETPLYREMRVESYLRFIARARHIPGAILRSRIDQVVGDCGLQSVIRKPISHLSKGFKQRVGLAQALIHEPDILILDEPTSGLDPNQILEIRSLIREVGKKKTVILSTHILQEVTAVCTEAIIIHRGSIAAQGPLDQLVKQTGNIHVYHAAIRGKEEPVLSALRSRGEFTEVELTQEQNGVPMYRITVDGSGDGGETIFEAVRDAGFSLSELHRSRHDLESLFHRLTTNG